MAKSKEQVTECNLDAKHCLPCEGIVVALSDEQIKEELGKLTGWQIVGGELVKSFRFKNYYETMAFVNATAWISDTENHHPDLEVSYNLCKVRYSTHAVKGLTENDFICAAKVDALIPA